MKEGNGKSVLYCCQSYPKWSLTQDRGLFSDAAALVSFPLSVCVNVGKGAKGKRTCYWHLSLSQRLVPTLICPLIQKRSLLPFSSDDLSIWGNDYGLIVEKASKSYGQQPQTVVSFTSLAAQWKRPKKDPM